MTQHFPLMTSGATSNAGTLEVHTLYDDSLIATVDTADKDAVEGALRTAYALFRDRDTWLTM
ncbi:MAG: hypothetical protein V3V96_08535, partial [Acidiferrobacterales bacterium]